MQIVERFYQAKPDSHLVEVHPDYKLDPIIQINRYLEENPGFSIRCMNITQNNTIIVVFDIELGGNHALHGCD